MMMEYFEGTDRFFFGRMRPTWTDMEQMRQLRKLVDLSRNQLEILRRDPGRFREQIAFEEVMLEATLKKLRRLELRFFVA